MIEERTVIYDDPKQKKSNLIVILLMALFLSWVAFHCGPNDTAIFVTCVLTSAALCACFLYAVIRWNDKRERIYLTETGLEDLKMKTGFIPYKEIAACCLYRSNEGSIEGVALELCDGSFGFPERKKLAKGYITFCHLDGFSTDDFYLDVVLNTGFTTMSRVSLCNLIKEKIEANERVKRKDSARKTNSLTIKEALLQGFAVLSFTALLFAFVLYFK